jgi:hypothetical protein
LVEEAYNPSTQDAEAGESLAQEQPGLHSEIWSQKQQQQKQNLLHNLYAANEGTEEKKTDCCLFFYPTF